MWSVSLLVLGSLPFVSGQSLRPAPVSCNAAFSAPCARTNSLYLTTATIQAFQDMQGPEDDKLERFLEQINLGEHNLSIGFYPFVFDGNGTNVAHGDNPDWVGLSLREIFIEVGVGFSDAEALHVRFSQAAESGGGWVQYLWSDQQDEEHGGVTINSKMAYVAMLTSDHYLGVGYENQRLPPDLPCSAEFNS